MKIIHRDIKPENLVFGADGYLHITDFGIARNYRDGNREDTSGTPGYMAPEVLLKKSHTFNSDLYAVGIILYEVIMKKVVRAHVAAVQRQNQKRNTRVHRPKRN
jgi:serum/glucocorticoid-regulated kinase 2